MQRAIKKTIKVTSVLVIERWVSISENIQKDILVEQTDPELRKSIVCLGKTDT